MMKYLRSIPVERLTTAFCVMFVVSLLSVMPDLAMAEMSGQEFDEVYTTLAGWIKGSLGRVIVIGMIIIGIIAGMARQSLMAFALGIGAGIGLYYTPEIVESIVSATATVPVPVI